MAFVQERAVSAEDRAEIVELIARYNRSIDNGDVEEFMGVFAEDIYWHGRLHGERFGREGMGQYLRELANAPEYRHMRGDGQHWVTNLILGYLEDGRVEGWATWLLILPSQAGPGIVSMGEYDDVYVDQGRRWLIQRRIITLTGFARQLSQAPWLGRPDDEAQKLTYEGRRIAANAE